MELLFKSLYFVLIPVLCNAITEEICEQKGEYIQCPIGKVLKITNVIYGRLRTGNCNPYRVPNLPTNCRSTVISFNTVVRLCNQRSQCFLEADNTILGEDPCNNIPKYLTVDYLCVDPITTPGKNPPTTPTTSSTTSTTTTTTTTTTTPTTTTSTTTRTTPTTPRTTTPTTTRRTTPTTTPTTTRRTTPTTTPTTTRQTTTRAPRVPFSPFNAPRGSQTCHDYLITGKNGVTNGQLSASSVYQGGPGENHGAERARLFSDAVRHPNGTYNMGAWSSAYNDQQQYVQVMLNCPSLIRGVATQGRHVNPADLCCFQHTTKYKIQYSLDCVNFETVKDSNGFDKIFTGNSDQDSVVTNMLPCPILARCVRINPVNWKDHVTLRFDLLGCPANTPDLGKCPNGWEERPGSNQCYLITDVNDMRTRDDASAQCQLQQGHLVKIDSIAERDWIRQRTAFLQQSQGQHHFWTGLSNRPRPDNTGHKWEDHTPLDTFIMPWGQGQPDNSGGVEHCGELWDGDLNDNECSQQYPYICEKAKFWQTPKNAPKPQIFHPPTPPARQSTQSTRSTRTTRRPTPPTARPYGRPSLPGSQTINGIMYTTGCLGQISDCNFKPAGDYQSCSGCHYYMTCAPSGVFTRPCPASLLWDDNLKTCSMISSTCGPVIG